VLLDVQSCHVVESATAKMVHQVIRMLGLGSPGYPAFQWHAKTRSTRSHVGWSVNNACSTRGSTNYEWNKTTTIKQSSAQHLPYLTVKSGPSLISARRPSRPVYHCAVHNCCRNGMRSRRQLDTTDGRIFHVWSFGGKLVLVANIWDAKMEAGDSGRSLWSNKHIICGNNNSN
jgi:hypothetical protein